MKKLINIIKHPTFMLIYTLIALIFIVYYIYSNWQVVPTLIATCRYEFILIVVMFGLLNMLSYCYVAYLLYQKLGAKVTLGKTLQIILASRLGLYLPGKIWYASNFYIYSRQQNIPALVVAQNFGLANLFLFITGGLCSLPIILPLLSGQEEVYLLIIISAILIMGHPKALKLLLSRFPKVRDNITSQLYCNKFGSMDYLKFMFCFIGLWIIAGLRLHFCILAISPLDYNHFFTTLAASAASLIFGVMAVFAPGGIGVREGVGTYILSGIITVEAAFVVMLLSRVLTSIIDLGGGVTALWLLYRVKNEKPAAIDTLARQANEISLRKYSKTIN